MKIAIVWASNDRSKYWNKILRDLNSKGYKVFPVNPKEDLIEWIKCIPSLEKLPKDIEVINIVTPPAITLEILKKAESLWMKNVWCQPWSTDDICKEFLESKWFKYIADSCIMIHSPKDN